MHLIQENGISYLVDYIKTQDNREFLRFLVSNRSINPEQSYVKYQQIEYQTLVPFGDQLEIEIYPDSFDLSEPEDGIHLKIEKMNFTRLTIPGVSLINSGLTTSYSTGYIDCKSKDEKVDLWINARVNFSYYNLKNLEKSQWLYIGASDGKNYFELGASKIGFLKGATWKFKSGNKLVIKNRPYNYSTIKILEKIKDSNSISIKIKIGKIKPKYLYLVIPINSFKCLWESEINLQHKIEATLEGMLIIADDPEFTKIIHKFDQSLLEIGSHPMGLLENYFNLISLR